MSVHSEDRATWLTKLERIGKLSAKDKVDPRVKTENELV